ncbi:ABC-F family ATP-binding cassette domain-containing protein [Mycoplasmatota bacterium]|nr:ABC-F family ATP-binding cassette domain-containing protein [Mycoplasmatota bacterium]
MDLSVNNITKSFAIYDVLKGVSFHINTGDKIGIVGANGSGKTTIFKVIKGFETPDSGEIFVRKGLKIGYLDQIPEYKETVTEVLYQAFTEILSDKERLNQLEKELSENPLDEKVLMRYGRAQEKFNDIGGYEIETEFNKIIKGLNISKVLLDKPFSILSGGEKSRVILGKILLEKPDILLLDEPSNHLDLQSISWLEGYLQKYKGSVLIISHDRYLLDRITNKIINIELGRAKVYHGNYSFYVKEKAKLMDTLWKSYANQEKKIKKMEDQIERFRIWGRMRDSDKMFRRAKTIEKKLDKMHKLDKPLIQKTFNLNFNNIGRTGKEVIKIENYSKSFDSLLLDNVNFTVRYTDRAFLIGKNGTGKSTIFKSILNEMDYQGKITLSGKTKIGVLSQEIVYQYPNRTILQEFRNSNPMTVGEARNKLASFLFYGDDVFKAVGDISGGEKSRLELCKMVNSDTNLLLLDEPTNHLDVESKEMLEQALLDYPGTLFIISHDRYFINKLSHYILCIEDKKINRYDGDYDIYFEKKEIKSKVKKIQKIRPTNIEKDYTKDIEKIENLIIQCEDIISNELTKEKPDFKLIETQIYEKELYEQEYEALIDMM